MAAATDGRPTVLYGRRRGRKLRPGRRRLMTTLLPRLAVSVSGAPGALDPHDLFDSQPPAVWLEIGFGAGEHLAEQARTHKKIGMIGAEVYVNGMAALLREIDRDGLDNLRLHMGDGRALLSALAPASIDRAFVLFPDPWPKTRHAKRRFVSAASLDALARVMVEGAELRIATDEPAHVGWILRHAHPHPAFAWLARGPADWRARPADWPATRYEWKASAAGRRSYYLRFCRRTRQPSPGTAQISLQGAAGSLY